jgi:hypothetical protein
MNNYQITSETRFQQQMPLQNSITLSYGEAKSRLSKLLPGTEEHCKLQDALLRIASIVEIGLPNINYKVDTFSENCTLLGGFGSSEHVFIGEKVTLHGLDGNRVLLNNGSVKYEHIIALAGDFYGVYGGAISLPGGSDVEKTDRFKKAFDTLLKADIDELGGLIFEIEQECLAVRNSNLPHHCYSTQLVGTHKRMKEIKRDIEGLLFDNSDHFSIDAKVAYSIGHTYAMGVAAEADGPNDLEKLKMAYAIDAFACHFLTDLFAAGHIRNQRGELELFLKERLNYPEYFAKRFAALLTSAQHEQDGNTGLNVHNEAGDRWIAFGDGNFLAPKNDINRTQVIAATQRSVDEIYAAFEKRKQISTMDDLMPKPAFFNCPPIYSVEDSINGKALFLHQGNKKTEIDSVKDYLLHGVAQALKYLPQEYIDGVLSISIDPLPIFDKVFIPAIERITGTVWHMVGLATYCQVKKEFRQLDKEMSEMAGVLSATYQNSIKILEQIGIINCKIDDLLWANTFESIKNSIETIHRVLHAHQNFPLQEWQKQDAEKQLWNAYINMSYIFSQNELLGIYKNKLELSGKNQEDIKVDVTLWFRQMLKCQVQAFSLYTSLQYLRNTNAENQVLLEQAKQFESDLMDQIQRHKDYIDETLICQTEGYIAHQIEINKTIQVSFEFLGNK